MSVLTFTKRTVKTIKPENNGRSVYIVDLCLRRFRILTLLDLISTDSVKNFQQKSNHFQTTKTKNKTTKKTVNGIL